MKILDFHCLDKPLAARLAGMRGPKWAYWPGKDNYLYWYTSSEEFPGNLEQWSWDGGWLYSDGFGRIEDGEIVYWNNLLVQTFEAEIGNLVLSTMDLEREPYALMTIPDVPYRLRSWMKQERTDDQQVEVYHEMRWSPPEMVENPAWWKDDESSALCVKLEEAWWDSRYGWIMGDGEIVSGYPSGLDVTFDRATFYAKDKGIKWRQDVDGVTTERMEHSWLWKPTSS